MITAAQAATTDYDSDTATETVTVDRGTSHLTFSLPDTGNVGTGDRLTFTSDSGDPVSFAVDPATTNNACTIPDAQTRVVYQHVGDCFVTATQAATTDYDTAIATEHVTVAKGTQTDHLHQHRTDRRPGRRPGLHRHRHRQLRRPGRVQLRHHERVHRGGLHRHLPPRRHLRDRRRPGRQRRLLRRHDRLTQPVTAPRAPRPSPSPRTAPPSPRLGGHTYEVTATGHLRRPGHLQLRHHQRRLHHPSGSTVTFRHAGTCVIAADQAGNDDYSDAPTVDADRRRTQGSQTITFTSHPTDRRHGGRRRTT